MLDDRRIGGVLLLLLIALAGYVFLPLWPALLLASWVAIVARPLMRKLQPKLRGPKRAALVTTLMVFLGVVVPLVVVSVPLVLGVVQLVTKLVQSGTAARALETVVQGGSESPGESLKLDLAHGIALIREHGSQAIDVLAKVAGSTMNVLLAFFVFMLGTYEFLAHGDELVTWFRERLPLPHLLVNRLSAAFVETGRGLFVGVGLTSLLQGCIATIAYLCLGIPRALVLGAVTTITSLFPGVGTALVWVPVSVGLYLSGRTGSAIIMLIVGAVVIGSVDNFLRPIFARYGNFRLSSFATLLSMFGGLTVFGSWGLLLGPLTVRLAVEAMELLFEMRTSQSQ